MWPSGRNAALTLTGDYAAHDSAALHPRKPRGHLLRQRPERAPRRQYVLFRVPPLSAGMQVNHVVVFREAVIAGSRDGGSLQVASVHRDAAAICTRLCRGSNGGAPSANSGRRLFKPARHRGASSGSKCAGRSGVLRLKEGARSTFCVGTNESLRRSSSSMLDFYRCSQRTLKVCPLQQTSAWHGVA